MAGVDATMNVLIAFKTIALADDLSATEKRCAAALLDHVNRRTGRCDPGIDGLAELLGLDERTVKRAVRALHLKGYVSKIRHGGLSHRNAYVPVWTRFQAFEAA